MIKELLRIMFYGITFCSLFVVDYLLGNGFIDMFQRLLCKVVCFVRKSIREEEKHGSVIGNENPTSISVLITELTILGLTIMFLNKYKQVRTKDHIDNLILESKETLQQTNDFLEKWRLRRINSHGPNEYTYLDEEPQKIVPFKLEVPILHMAIIDTLGTSRNQLERGDAGDTNNFADSTLLSMTSLLEDGMDSVPEIMPKINESSFEGRSHHLWDLMEEDPGFDD